MQNDQSRAITAVLISGVILFAWQFFFAPPKPTTETTQIVESTQSQIKTTTSSTQATEMTDKEGSAAPIGATAITISKNAFSYTINDSLTITEATYEGMSASEKVFETKELLNISLVKEESSFLSVFNLSKTSEDSFSAVNNNFGLTITGKIQDNGTLAFAVTKETTSPINNLQLRFKSIPGENDNYQIRSFVYSGTDLETISVGSEEKESMNIRWLGMDYLYHLFAVSFDEKIPANLTTSTTNNSFRTFVPLKENTQNFNLIFIKKNYDLLKSIGNNLHLSVDFGIFSFLAIPILRGLQFFYNLVLNYGIAIIFLTFIIRLLTFPLQYKSTKSMKKMQVIQPELKKIQKKFKDNPQRLQKESMELFKRAGANPLSGCFPLLLQMPIFFAFYKVLYNAVELVDAPFYFWIHDLSQKDPYYVLPVLMTASMFLQQKLTPTATTDPAQQKVMMIMPIVFGFIMKDLPSGLNLYIFISTLIAIVLQMAVLKKIKA